MKKIFLTVFVLAMLVSFPHYAHADEQDFIYSVSDGEATVTGCTSHASDVTVPDILGGCPVTAIGDGAFMYCDSMTYLTLPSGIRSIGQDAFRDCVSLAELNLPDAVETIGDGAFQSCSSLKRIHIGKSVSLISDNAFLYCFSLTEYSVDDENASYASSDGVLFDKDFDTLVSYPTARYGAYTVPETVSKIGRYAFLCCSSLTDITLPNSLREIGEYAFNACGPIAAITLPEGVERIGNYAFGGSFTLQSIYVPDSVVYIGEDVFGTSFDEYCGLIVYCGAGAAVHRYVSGRDIPFEVMLKTTAIGGCETNVDGIRAARDADGEYTLRVGADETEDLLCTLAEFDGGVFVGMRVADENGVMTDIDETDIGGGKIFIWRDDIRPCTEPVNAALLFYGTDDL